MSQFTVGAATAVPGNFTLISTTTASDQANVDIVSGLSSSYKMMKIIATGIQLVNNGGQALWMRCSTNAGVSYDTGNNYSYNEQYFGSDSSNDWNRSSADAKMIVMIPYPDSATSTNSGSFEMSLYNISNAALHATFMADVTANQTTTNYNIRFSGSYNVTGAVNGIRFLGANGNIFAGNFYLYGVS